MNPELHPQSRPGIIHESPVFECDEGYCQVRVVGRFILLAPKDSFLMEYASPLFVIFFARELLAQLLSMARSNSYKVGVTRRKSRDGTERVILREVVHGREAALARARELTDEIARRSGRGDSAQ